VDPARGGADPREAREDPPRTSRWRETAPQTTATPQACPLPNQWPSSPSAGGLDWYGFQASMAGAFVPSGRTGMTDRPQAR
jgi:hypothetical protein